MQQTGYKSCEVRTADCGGRGHGVGMGVGTGVDTCTGRPLGMSWLPLQTFGLQFFRPRWPVVCLMVAYLLGVLPAVWAERETKSESAAKSSEANSGPGNSSATGSNPAIGGSPALGSSGRSIASASLEELLQVKVTSISRRPQRLSKTAGAVSIITAEEIRRSGLTNLADLFRMVPGLSVSQVDGGKFAISARGFLDRFANKMLVLIDGRSIYSNIFSGVTWESYGLLLQDIERIEVVRGPGARSWGPNAVNGIINIITRRTEDTEGDGVVVGGGHTDRPLVGVRKSVRLGRNLRAAGSARIAQSGGFHLPSGVVGNSAGQGQELGRTDAQDGLATQRGSLRLEWNRRSNEKVTVWADLHRGEGSQWMSPNTRVSTPWQPRREPYSIDGGAAMVRWDWSSERLQTGVQAYYLRDNRVDATMGKFENSVADFDSQGEWNLSATHTLTWGAGYRRFQNQLQDGRQVRFQGPENINHMASTFVEYEWEAIPDRLSIAGGTKVLRETFSGTNLQPGIRAIYTPTKDSGIWVSLSQAHRTLSLRDVYLTTRINARDVLPNLFLDYGPGQGLQPEGVVAYEAGFRKAWGNRVSADVASYYASYSDIPRWRPLAAQILPGATGNILLVPFFSTNAAAARSRGIEVSTHWRARKNLQWSNGFGYGTVSFWDQVGVVPNSLLQAPTSPGLFVHSRVAWDFHPKWSLDSWATRTSQWDRRYDTRNLRWDARLSFRPRAEYEFSGVFRNMAARDRLEYNYGDFAVGSIAPRGLFVQFQRFF